METIAHILGVIVMSFSSHIRKNISELVRRFLNTFLLILAGMVISLPANADLVTIVGDTTGQPTFDRATCPGFGDICLPTAQATNGPHNFQALRFRVTRAGSWQIGTNTPLGTDHGDTHLSLYQGTFNPSQPLQNVFLVNDDNTIFGAGFDSGIVGDLSTGTNYTSVVSSYGAGSFGRYLLSFLGPGTIILSDAEIATASQNASITASRSFMGTVMRRLGKRHGKDNLFAVNAGNPLLLASADPMAGASLGSYVPNTENSSSYWFSGHGGNISFDGDASTGSSSVDSSQGGFTFGYDHWFTDSLIVGIAAGIGRSFYDIDAFGSEGDSGDYNIVVYGGWNQGQWYADALLGYGGNSHNVERAVSGTTAALSGNFDTDQFLFTGEVGHHFGVNEYKLTPFARAEVTAEWQDGYTESGVASGLVPLTIDDRSFTAIRTTLGVSAQRDFTILDNKKLTLDVEAGWAHEFNNDRTVKASISGVTGFISSVPGAGPDSDLAIYSIAAEVPVDWPNNVSGSIYLGYQGQKGSDVTDHNGFGGIRIYF